MIASACLCENLRRATRVVTRAYDDALRPHGLRITQFSLLAALGSGGESRVRDLAAAVALEETSLLRNLGPLARRKLVTIHDGEDKRERYVAISAAGRALLTRAAEPWRAAQDELRKTLTPAVWDPLFGALESLASRPPPKRTRKPVRR